MSVDSYEQARATIQAAPAGEFSLPDYLGDPGDLSYLRAWVIEQVVSLYNVPAETFDTPNVYSTSILRDFVHRALYQTSTPLYKEDIINSPEFLGWGDVALGFRYPLHGLCGDMAWQMYQVYRAFGYPANEIATVDGDIQSYGDSHVTVQVYVVDLDKYIYQDATFNFLLRDEAGTILSFYEAREANHSSEIVFDSFSNYRWYHVGETQEVLDESVADYFRGHYFETVYWWYNETGVRETFLPDLYVDKATAHDPGSAQGGVFVDRASALEEVMARAESGASWQAIAGSLRGEGLYVSGFSTTDGGAVTSEWLTVRLSGGGYLSINIDTGATLNGSIDQLQAELFGGPALNPGADLSALLNPTVLLSRTGVLMPAGLGSQVQYTIGTAGSEALTGGIGSDWIYGLGGDDQLDGAGGGDVLIGGRGDDHYVVRSGSDTVWEFLGEGTDTVTAQVSYALKTGVHVEVLRTIDATATTLLNLTGNAFVNTLYGNAGANVLDGGRGADTLVGYGGNDTYYVDDPGDQVVEQAGGGSDTVITTVSYALAAGSSIETLRTPGSSTPLPNPVDLTGNELNNTLVGNDGPNRLDGRGGADTFWGYGGNDTYVVDNVGDRVVEAVGGGDDTVLTSVDFTIAPTAEIETLSALDPLSTVGLTLTGNAGVNRLVGAAGADRLNGGGGADTLIGGGGNDTYDVDNSGDQVIELDGEGDDLVLTSVSFALAVDSATETLRASNAASKISLDLWGSNIANRLYGNAGANRLDGGAGADILTGYAGSDTYYVDNAGDRVIEQAGGGNDTVITSVSFTLEAGSEVETLRTYGSASTYAVDLTGNGFANTLVGNAASNRLDGGGGADAMWGYGGDDVYVVDHAGDAVVELAGEGLDRVETGINYTLPAHVESLTLTGAANLSGTGNNLDNTITGNGGANRLDGAAGADTLIGLGGNDSYYVDNAGDRVVEQAGGGADVVYTLVSYALEAGSEVERLSTYGSASTYAVDLTGNALDNTLVGNAAANRLDGRGGADVMWAYGGDDVYVVDHAGDVVVELAGEGVDRVEAGIDYTLPAHVESLTLTGSANLAGTGNNLDNTITGNGGANRLDGAAGADTLIGLGGNDSYYVDIASDRVVEQAGGGTDAVYTLVSYALEAGSEVERLSTYGSATTYAADLTGNELANTLVGNAAGNRLDGRGGADVMWAYGGDDVYVVDHAGDAVVEFAGEGVDRVEAGVDHTLAANVEDLLLTGAADLNGGGNDGGNRITGNAGANRLTGAGGDDVLRGGGGSDTLTGGAGADRFVFAEAGDAGDVITDFTPGADTLDLSLLLDSLGYTGSDPFADGYLTTVATAQGTEVLFDPDGGSDGFVPLLLVEGLTPQDLTPASWVF